MSPSDLHFLRPEWFWALLPLALLLLGLARLAHDANPWRGLIDAHLLPHLLIGDGGRVRRSPLALLALGWLIGVTALAGPVWERRPQPVFQAQAQRVIVLDISANMNATDLPPSRLAQARFATLDLLARFREGQSALIAYGSEPFIVSPLTRDADTIAAQVPSLGTDLLPIPGAKRTDLALAQAGDLLRQAGSTDGEVILITDGLEQPAAAQAAAGELRAAGFRVSVLGVGTPEGAPIPLSTGGFMKDEHGAIRVPKLDSAALTTLAQAGGGHYVTSTLDDRDIEALVGAATPDAVDAADDAKTEADQWREEGPWLLLALLPLAALAFRRGWLSPLMLALFLAPPPAAEAFSWADLWLRPDQRGARALEQGREAQAAEAFQRPDWRAAAHYRAGQYEPALEDLEQLDGVEVEYNRGNALARLGRLEDALVAYDQVLTAKPDHEDARHNRELVEQLLEAQRQAQQMTEDQTGQGQQGQGQPDASGRQSGGEDQAGEPGRGGGGEGQTAQSSPSQQAGQPPAEDSGQEQGGQSAAAAGAQPSQGAAAGAHRPQAADQADAPPAQGPDQDGSGETAATAEAHAAQAPSGVEAASPTQDSAAADPSQPTNEAEREDAGAASAAAAPPSASAGAQSEHPMEAGAAPTRGDLLGGDATGDPRTAAVAEEGDAGGEDRQAMEHLLRRVPDDPAGLLRQRFLLQHLRRNGRL